MHHYNISFAGAGRVAGTLCREMFRAGFKILQIVSENGANGRLTARSCGAEWSSVLDFNDSNDIIIVAVPDHKLKDVLSGIRCSSRTLVVHTAGSCGLEMFPSRIEKTGVFYPLQTFSKGREVRLKNLPFFIEAKDESTRQTLVSLAETLGGKTFFADSERRKLLHVSAVFVNNFTNFMLTEGTEIASKAGFSPDILEPLIRETISKALENGPSSSQTGPAIRNDIDTIEKHMKLLSFSPDLLKLYSEVTHSILKHYKIGS
jgi:predicted short-subunit dehydrogenase-like oxidoreductase (DUF2520 family)